MLATGSSEGCSSEGRSPPRAPAGGVGMSAHGAPRLPPLPRPARRKGAADRRRPRRGGRQLGKGGAEEGRDVRRQTGLMVLCCTVHGRSRRHSPPHPVPRAADAAAEAPTVEGALAGGRRRARRGEGRAAAPPASNRSCPQHRHRSRRSWCGGVCMPAAQRSECGRQSSNDPARAVPANQMYIYGTTAANEIRVGFAL